MAKVQITCPTDGAEILYSTEGGTPDTTYSSEIDINSNGVYPINAIGRKEGYLDSETATEEVAYFDGYIYTPEDLIAFSRAAQEDLTINATLMNDIDMAECEYEYTPPGRNLWNSSLGNYGGYEGVFEGNGHTINNLTILDHSSYYGLVGTLASNGAVQNLNLFNVTLGGNNTHIGGIVGYCYGTIENCSVSGSISLTNGQWKCVGGIAGVLTVNSRIVACHNYANINCSTESNGGDDVGGIVGSSHGTIIACYNTGNITYSGGTSRSSVGGIVGDVIDYNEDVEDCLTAACYNIGTVSLSDNEGYVGGIIGSRSTTVGSKTTVYVTDCYYSSDSADAGSGSSYTYNITTTAVSSLSEWQEAATVMNTYLSSNGYNYRYTYTGNSDEPLTLSSIDTADGN